MYEHARKSFQEDGAALIRGCLDEKQLQQCRAAFDWLKDNPGPHASSLFQGTDQQSFVDNSNPKAKPRLDDLVDSLPLGRLFAEIWGSKNVWYFAEEVFFKTGGVGSPSLWHQDTSYLPWAGSHWGNAWISFESVPKRNALGIVRASHRGIQYDGTTFRDPRRPTEPLHGGGALPELPNVEANRDAFDILSWATDPGDVVVLHPRSIHGGAPVDKDFPTRHTLVFRFFGDDASFRHLPDSAFTRRGYLFQEATQSLQEGEPYRSPVFRKVY